MRKAVIALALTAISWWSGVSTATAADLQNCVIKPAGNIVTPAMASQINNLRPWSQAAAGAENVNWLYVVVLLYRENSLLYNNPGNGQGAFQLYSYVESWRQQYAKDHGTSVAKLSSDITPFPSTDGDSIDRDDFISQARLALQHLQTDARQVKTLGLASPDALTIAWAFFTYNGRDPAYYDQAARLHQRYPGSYLYPFEGSPYVYNNWDAAHTGDLYIVQSDGGRLGTHVDDKVGAFTLYYELERQCEPDKLPAVSPSLEHPAERPSPFVGQSAPPLPPQGKLPHPWYAAIGLLGAGLLALTIAPALRRPWLAVFWIVNLLVAAMAFHADDVTLHRASYVFHAPGWELAFYLVALVVGAILAVFGLPLALEQREQILGYKWVHIVVSPPSLSKYWRALVSQGPGLQQRSTKAVWAAKCLAVLLAALAYFVVVFTALGLAFILLGLYFTIRSLAARPKSWCYPALVAFAMWIFYRLAAPANPAQARFSLHFMLVAELMAVLFGLLAYRFTSQNQLRPS